MMKKISLASLFLLIGFVMTGCATTEQSANLAPQIKLEDMMAEAQSAANAGKNDVALAVLEKATGIFPAEKAAWLKIAQMQFDGANYGSAVTNAQEVLQRNPEDRLANSIIAVSGLRLSTKALADLSRHNNLSGSLRTEAQDLAKLLRETLGEPVLVPVQGRDPAPRQRRAPAARPAPSKVPKPASASTANPFGALK